MGYFLLNVDVICVYPLKENHIGKFPANFCIKMIGTSSKTVILYLR